MCCRGCAPTPKFIKSCSIRNDSDEDVEICINYFQHPGAEEDSSPHQRTATLPKGQAHRAESRTVKYGTCELNSHIVNVQVTFSDGRKFEVNDPFDGVSRIEPDWLFVIDNQNIRSCHPTA